MSIERSLSFPGLMLLAFAVVLSNKLSGAPVPCLDDDSLARVFSSVFRRIAADEKKKRRDDALIKIGQQPFFR